MLFKPGSELHNIYDLIVNCQIDPHPINRGTPAIAYDRTSESFMVVWEDNREGDNNIFGQTVEGWDPLGSGSPPPGCGTPTPADIRISNDFPHDKYKPAI